MAEIGGLCRGSLCRESRWNGKRLSAYGGSSKETITVVHEARKVNFSYESPD